MASTAVVYNLIARDRASKTFQRVAKEAETLSQKTDRVGRKVTSAGKGLTTGLTLPLVGVGFAALKMGEKFETSMLHVKAVTGASGKSFKKLEDQAKRLGATTQFSASEAADAMGFLGQAGFSTNQIMKAMPATLDMAAASGMELADAADVTSNVLRGFNLKASQASHVANVLAKSSAKTNADVQDMGEAMAYVAPVAAASGLSIEQTAAAVGMLSNAGIKGSMAGTTLRGAISRLSKPTRQAEKALSRLGINAVKSNGQMRPLDKVISQLGKSGATTADYMTIFGQRAGPGMQALVAQGAGSLRKLTKGLKNSGGAAKKMAKTQMSGLDGAMKRLKSAAEGLAISIAESGLLDMFTRWGNKLAKFIGKLSQANPKFIRMGVVIAAIAAAIGPVLIVAGSLIVAIARVSMAIKAMTAAAKVSALWIGGKFKAACIGTRIQLAALRIQTIAVAAAQKAMKVGAMAAAVGQRILNVAMRANPIGIIITLIAGLVAALVWFFTKTKLGRKIITAAWAAIKRAIHAVANWFVGTVLPAIRKALRIMGNAFKWIYAKIIRPTFNGWKRIIGAVWKWIHKYVVTPVIRFFTVKIPNAFKRFQLKAKVYWLAAKLIMNRVWKWIHKWIITPVIDFFTKKIPNAFRAFRRVVGNVWGGVKSVSNRIWKWIKKWIVDPVIKFFRTTIPAAFRKFRDVAGDVWEKLKGIISRPFTWIKKHVLNPLINFVKKTIPDAFDRGVDAVKRIWGKIANIAKKPIKFVIGTVLNKGLIKAFNSVTDFLKLEDLKISPIRMPKGFRDGGYTGAGSPDKVVGPAHADEFYVKSRSRRKFERNNPGVLDHINRTGALPNAAGHAAFAPHIIGGTGGGYMLPTPNVWTRAGRMRVGREPGWNIDQAAKAWQNVTGIDVRAGAGSPHVATFSGGLAGYPVAMTRFTGNGASIQFDNSKTAGWSSRLKTATAAHEIGHALGLPHVTGRPSIMDPMMADNLWPNAADRALLRGLYGKGSGKLFGPGDGGGGFFSKLGEFISNMNPVKWVINKITDSVKGLIEKIPGAGDVLDLAIGAAKKLFDVGKKWVINTAKDIMGIGYAGGTHRASPGWRWVGERGPELMKFHGGERVKNHRDSMRYVNGTATRPSSEDRPVQVVMPETFVLKVGDREFTAYVDERAVIASGNRLASAQTRLSRGGVHV